MKKIMTLAAFALAGALSAESSAQLLGSDTLFNLTNDVLDNCPASAPLTYVGQGSTNGEIALMNELQEVSSMSRILQARTCRGPDPQQSECQVLALDGLAIVGDPDNTQCTDGIADETEVAMPVLELNGSAGLQCPGCAGTDYVFANDFDVLRVIFAGMHNNGGSAIANKACSSDVRHTLVNNFSNIFTGNCAAGECTQLNHAFRRADLSGTTDSFLSILGLPSLTQTAAPFCNGTQREDVDPIRRNCVAADDVCSADGKAGLVLPVNVPDNQPASVAFPQAACASGKFGLRPALTTPLPGGGTRFDCPERANFSIAGFCLAPLTSANNADCLSPPSNPNVFFPSLTDDARLLNKWVRHPNGDLVLSGEGEPMINAWYRMRGAPGECQENSSTTQIGCLADQVPCSIGFAGREATEPPIGVGLGEALTVGGVLPTTAAVQQLSLGGGPGTYPLARELYYCTMVGFQQVSDPLQDALSACMRTPAILDPAVANSGFVPLPPGGVTCRDFNETTCGGAAISCLTNADCGVFDCVGGFCSNNCVVDADCSEQPGATCISGRCDFAANTANACEL